MLKEINGYKHFGITMSKIAVIGSRDFTMVNRIVNRLLRLKEEYPVFELISGGARGVDKHAEEFAEANQIPLEVIRPINPKDKFSYLLRNVEIITKADKILAFWDGKSKGTKFVIDYAKARGKNIEIIK